MTSLKERVQDEQLQLRPIDAFLHKIGNRSARIAVVGLGYVGLPLAHRFCSEGFTVTGLDVDTRRVDLLNKGGTYIESIQVEQIMRMKALGFRATVDAEEIGASDVVIICVPTPLGNHREPDLSYIRSTAQAIAAYVHSGQLIVLESTTYPGTTEEVLIPILESENLCGLRTSRNASQGDFYVAYSPEREDPGNASFDRRDIPKVVSGIGAEALEMADATYQTIFARTVPVSSPAVAEMSKLLENIYRCVNIALVNELKQLCHRMNIDIYEVIDAAKTKPFGFHAFYPGPGLGGHCIPVDPFYLSWKAKQFDFSTKFIELAGEVNRSMPEYVVTKTAEALNLHSKALRGSRILLLGIAYKRDVDDIRESPAIPIIGSLRRHGALVSFNDPYCPYLKGSDHSSIVMTSVPLDSLGDYDCVLICTDHSKYDFAQIVHDAQLIVDSRNATQGARSTKIVHC